MPGPLHLYAMLLQLALRTSPTLQETWMIALFFVLFGILAYLRVAYSKRFFKLLQAVYSVRMVRQAMREELSFTHRVSLFLLLVYTLNGGMVLYLLLISQRFPVFGLSGFGLFLLCAAAFLLLLCARIISLRAIGWITQQSLLTAEYEFHLLLMNKFLALAWLPPLMLMAFGAKTHVTLWMMAALLMFCVAWLLRVVRGIGVALESRISGVYIILYLCSLEIMPLLFAVKAFSNF